MSADKNELIAKLEKISELYSDTVEIATEIKNFTPEDNYKRKTKKPKFNALPDEGFEDIIDHESPDAEEVMALGYEKAMAPKEPVKPIIEEFKESAKPDTKNMGCLSWVGLIGAGFIVVGGINDPSVFTMPLSYVIIAVFLGLFIFAKFKIKQEESRAKNKNEEALKNYNKNKADILAKYDSDLKAYKENCDAFTIEKEKVMKEYKEWRKKYLAYLNEETEIEEKLKADRALAVNRMFEEKFTPAKTKLDEYNNELIAEEYLPSINVIISLLKSGRADDLKEAINLYEEIVYKEKQLQLEREKEEQRRLEEERRRQDEERRYREEMSFKEEQERQRRREAEQARRDEKRRAEERETREREEAYKAKKSAEAQAKSNCHWCKNYRNCAKHNNPPLNCPAFRPGNTHQI